jgi:hypothetical protein
MYLVFLFNLGFLINSSSREGDQLRLLGYIVGYILHHLVTG